MSLGAWVLLFVVGLPIAGTVLYWLCFLLALPFAARQSRKYRSR
jgi:hypothetical protein